MAMTDPRHYKITIFGEVYSIVSDEPEARIVSAVQLVDASMKTIAAAAPSFDLKQILLLTALQIAGKCSALEQENSGALRAQQELVELIAQTLE